MELSSQGLLSCAGGGRGSLKRGNRNEIVRIQSVVENRKNDKRRKMKKYKRDKERKQKEGGEVVLPEKLYYPFFSLDFARVGYSCSFYQARLVWWSARNES